MGLKDFLQAPFVVNQQAHASALIARVAAKWLLELLRNIIVVAFLFVVARKSGKWYMDVVAAFGFAAIWAYLMSYWDALGMNLVPFQKRWVAIAVLVVMTVFLCAFVIFLMLGLLLGIEEITHAQSRQ
jgi:hypothetical protein